MPIVCRRCGHANHSCDVCRAVTRQSDAAATLCGCTHDED